MAHNHFLTSVMGLLRPWFSTKGKYMEMPEKASVIESHPGSSTCITIFIRIAEATRKWPSSKSLVIPSYTFLPVVFLYQGAIVSWLGLCYRVYMVWKLSSMLRLSGSVAAFSHPQTFEKPNRLIGSSSLSLGLNHFLSPLMVPSPG